MGDGIEVDVDALRHGGEGLRQAAHRMRQEWSGFDGRVQSMGDIFGDDMVGGLIGASYHAAHDIAEKSFLSVADALDAFGTGLVNSADNHERTEAEAAELFRRLMR